MECANHTPCPNNYIEWHEWAKKMSKTHIQTKCPDCQLYNIWKPKSISKKSKRLTAVDYIKAARVPEQTPNMEFGNWRLDRVFTDKRNEGFNDFVCLRHLVKPDEINYENMHKVNDDGFMWDVVMEDSTTELKKHLPIWMNATGHVLKTGLGLGCVVRGLLINPEVTKVTVIEIDPDIALRIGNQFKDNPRVNLIVADAMTFDYSSIDKVDYAWHDIWTPENKGLQTKHAELIKKLGMEIPQGAWAMPRKVKKIFRRVMPNYIG